MKIFARRISREFALQAIYSWQFSKNNIFDIGKYCCIENNNKYYDVKYFYFLISGVVKNINYLDNIINNQLFANNIKIIGQIEKAILRISILELTKRNDIPYKVVINESIELAKSFGHEKSHKFINGFLDNLGLKIRPNKI